MLELTVVNKLSVKYWILHVRATVKNIVILAKYVKYENVNQYVLKWVC